MGLDAPPRPLPSVPAKRNGFQAVRVRGRLPRIQPEAGGCSSALQRSERRRPPRPYLTLYGYRFHVGPRVCSDRAKKCGVPLPARVEGGLRAPALRGGQGELAAELVRRSLRERARNPAGLVLHRCEREWGRRPPPHFAHGTEVAAVVPTFRFFFSPRMVRCQLTAGQEIASFCRAE